MEEAISNQHVQQRLFEDDEEELSGQTLSGQAVEKKPFYNRLQSQYYKTIKNVTREKIDALLKHQMALGEKAVRIEKKLEQGTAEYEDILEVLYEILASLDSMPVKFVTLYQGVFKRALHLIIKNYKEYYIGELLKEYENRHIAELFKVAIDNVRYGREGTKGLNNVVKALYQLGELMRINQIEVDKSYGVAKEIGFKLVQNFNHVVKNEWGDDNKKEIEGIEMRNNNVRLDRKR